MGGVRSSLLFVFAHPLEGELLVRRGLPAIALGVGKVAAATTLARHLSRPEIAGGSGIERIVSIGVAGAYPKRHRPTTTIGGVGEIRAVGETVLADEGVEAGDSFMDLRELGLGAIGPVAFDVASTERLAALIGRPPARTATVSTCAGSERLSALRAERFGAELETMESAAIVAVGRAFDVRVIELRCVSNWTGDRDQGEFALAESAAGLQKQILSWIDSGRFEDCFG